MYRLGGTFRCKFWLPPESRCSLLLRLFHLATAVFSYFGCHKIDLQPDHSCVCACVFSVLFVEKKKQRATCHCCRSPNNRVHQFDGRWTSETRIVRSAVKILWTCVACVALLPRVCADFECFVRACWWAAVFFLRSRRHNGKHIGKGIIMHSLCHQERQAATQRKLIRNRDFVYLVGIDRMHVPCW